MSPKKDEIIISETTPFIVGDLSVFPNRLKYKGRKCNFQDIKSLRWYWLSQTINFLNKQKVWLSIYVSGNPKPIEIKKTTLYVTPKLVTAYNFIAQETFEARLRKYVNQLEGYGGFRYQNVIIYSDGRVVEGDKTFLLQNARYEPFKLSIKQAGIFSSKLNLDITLDRDVILALINFILKNPQDAESIRENARRRKEAEEAAGDFLPDLICMLAKISKADGVVSSEEIRVIKDFFRGELKLDDKSYGIAISIFNTARESPEPIRLHARNILNDLGSNNSLLVSILDLLFSVAIADGHFSAEEELLISEVETMFGVKGRTQYSNFRDGNRRQKYTNLESRYYDILGLSPEAKPSQIKITYRRLVMQYHPDRVQHLGPEFRALAEEKIKQINEAYTFFQNKYSL